LIVVTQFFLPPRFSRRSVLPELRPDTPSRHSSVLCRFLIDLDGWQGNKPDGMAMEISSATMITATRRYQKSPAHLEASIIIGTAAQAALAAAQSGIKIETTEGRLGTSSINGFQVTQTYTIKEKDGAILVALGPAAMFNLAFNGVTDQDALALAEKFDWKGIQAALPK
jgi:hypothetical protein